MARKRRRSLASTVLFLFGAIIVGVPSHHHDEEDEPGRSVTAAEHHGHGMALVEVDDRIQSYGPLVALPTSVMVLDVVPGHRPTSYPSLRVVRPRGRAPPANPSRAPPNLS